MNPMSIMKIKSSLECFQANHPRVAMFFRDIGPQIQEGAVIEVTVTTAEGKELCTNMRVTADDMELIKQLKDLSR